MNVWIPCSCFALCSACSCCVGGERRACRMVCRSMPRASASVSVSAMKAMWMSVEGCVGVSATVYAVV